MLHSHQISTLAAARPATSTQTTSLHADIRRELIERSPATRVPHVLGVEGMVLVLAHHWQMDVDKALTAALCHDLAKPFPPSVQRERLDAVTVVPVSEEDRACAPIWHGIVAAQEAFDTYGVRDPDVLGAIAWHSTGPESLAPTGLLLFVADFLEPSRDWPGVEEFRRRVFDNTLQEAAFAVALAKVTRLREKGREIHSRTFRLIEHLTPIRSKGPTPS